MNKLREFSDNYLELLKGEFAGINLTRIDSPEEFYYKQILDSVKPLEESQRFVSDIKKTKVVIDIGFGGGFPILPLAKENPDVKFIGIDARGKKANVVNQIAERLGIKNAKCFHGRIEEVDFDVDAVLTFKAVGDVQDFLPLISTNKSLTVYFYKGPNFYELEDIEKTLKQGWTVVEEVGFDVPMTDGRLLIGFKNKNVLRGTKIPKKIKISELL
ncbi:MAG: class I SAM-dependent methyltransferase [Bacteriovoracaceae bacterium]|jgi:16S rRNA (guanine527-N7)-methyltransferase|nr:class I SAM-dependent methyltransferase [Bacteriovoracaceae bacterium]